MLKIGFPRFRGRRAARRLADARRPCGPLSARLRHRAAGRAPHGALGMKALLILWAKSFAALLVAILVLALAQQWDEADTARARADMQRSA